VATLNLAMMQTHDEHDSKEVGHEEKGKFIGLVRPLLAEFLGTAFFIAIGMMGACSNSGVFTTAFSFGMPLMILSAGFGHMSGAYFNPAVTVGALLAKEIKPIMAVCYFLVQIIGGIAAAGFVKLVLSRWFYSNCHGGATLLAKRFVQYNVSTVLYDAEASVQWWQGTLIEFMVTFVFVTIFIMVAADLKAKTSLAPLIIGFAFVGCMLASNAFTGGSLNPARSLGPAIFANEWKDHYVYWLGPLIGAVLAGVVYRFVWAYKDRRITKDTPFIH